MKLAKYLKDNKIKRVAAAHGVETTPATITRVCQGKPCLPETARRIITWTDGAVTWDDLYPPKPKGKAA